MPCRDDLNNIACSSIDQAADDLSQLSSAIYNKPEPSKHQQGSREALAAFLEEKGFSVQRVYKTDAFLKADYGKGAPSVAILCDYAAEEVDMRHVCSLASEAGVAAALGVKAAMEVQGLGMGKLLVLGTPADHAFSETGKSLLQEHGGFRDVDCTIAAQPAVLAVTRCNFAAVHQVRVTFQGRSKHSAADPVKGVNALDASVVAYNTINHWKRELKPGSSIQGTITHGGILPNFVPELTESYYWLRAPHKDELRTMRETVTGFFQNAATATACKVENMEWETISQNVLQNDAMIGQYEEHLESLGIQYEKHWPDGHWGSSSMGAVSHAVPSMFPTFSIGSDADIQSKDFITAAGDSKAQPGVLKIAKAMAMTVLDVMFDPDLLAKVQQTFQEDTKDNA